MKELEYFQNNRSILCIVADTKGSCPGQTGFKMVVCPDGSTIGSVGGGTLEYKVITAAAKMLKNGESEPVLIPYDHNRKADEGESSGMICSGKQKILLVPYPPSNRLTEQTCGFLVSVKALEFTAEHYECQGLSIDNQWTYTENLKLPETVYIFGGGHCSLALTPILNSLNMRTVIIDDRENVHTMKANHMAWRKIHSSYLESDKLVPDDGKSIVVIMPASHEGDAVILRQMLGKNLKYLGMMASRTTAHHIFTEMRNEGFTEKQLAAVHSPIGIPIGSHTPSEIAVSIAAEIVSVCNRNS